MVVYTDAAPGLAATTILLTTLALITFGLRAYCRLSRRSWGPEDWIMTAALVCSPHKPRIQPNRSYLTQQIGAVLCPCCWMSWRGIQWNWCSHYYPCEAW